MDLEDGITSTAPIQSQLKEHRALEADSLLLQVLAGLIQSHLHDARLDIQTYSQLAQGLIRDRADASYLQVFYTLFRVHFSASPLMYPTF